MRDPYTAGHERRVATLSRRIVEDCLMCEDDIEGIFLAASIHDIGKIAIPAEILAKPRKLNEIELRVVKTHPFTGYTIVKDLDFPWPVSDMVYSHHERLDGSGYPNGLKGMEIGFPARVVAVANVVESMCSHRPYRSALGVDAALEHIYQHRGSQYDSAVVDTCVCLFTKRGFTFEEAKA